MLVILSSWHNFMTIMFDTCLLQSYCWIAVKYWLWCIVHISTSTHAHCTVVRMLLKMPSRVENMPTRRCRHCMRMFKHQWALWQSLQEIFKISTTPACLIVGNCIHISQGVRWHVEAETKWLPFLQTIFSNAFSWMKIFVFWFTFYWNFFLRIQLTKFQH